jgi:hypothetical protein
VGEPQPKVAGFLSGWTAFAAGTAALLTAVGGLIGGLAAAGVIGGNGEAVTGAPTSATTSTSTTTAKTFVTFTATPDEKRLLSVVPAEIQPSCDRPTESDKRLPSAVIVFCYDPAALDDGYVRWALFDSTASLEKYMNERRTLGNASQRCGTRSTGAALYRGSDSQPMGLLICYVDKFGAWIEWTNVPADVYGLANRPDGDWRALYDFWARVGPINAPAS